MMSTVQFKEVWKDETQRSVSEAFWSQVFEKIPFEASKRSEEVVMHVKDENNVIGLSTAEVVQLERFNQHKFYNYRMLIHPNYRLPGLADTLAVKSFQFLENLQENHQDGIIGIISLIQDQRIISYKSNPVYRATGLVFAGYTSSGAQIRLKYFSGARI